MAANAHPIVHVEISALDPRKSGDFYQQVFGWKIEVEPSFDYVQFQPDSGPGGAFPKVDDQTYKVGDVLVYIGADDIEATLAQIEKAGGKMLIPKTEIPGYGWWAVFADPNGTRMALYTGRSE